MRRGGWGVACPLVVVLTLLAILPSAHGTLTTSHSIESSATTTCYSLEVCENSTTVTGDVAVPNDTLLNEGYQADDVSITLFGGEIYTDCSSKSVVSLYTGIGGWSNTTKTFDSSKALKAGLTITCSGKSVEYQLWYDVGSAKRVIEYTDNTSVKAKLSYEGVSNVSYNASTGNFRIYVSFLGHDFLTYIATSKIQRDSIEWLMEDRGTDLPDFQRITSVTGSSGIERGAEGWFGNATNSTETGICSNGDDVDVSSSIGCVMTFSTVTDYTMVNSKTGARMASFVYITDQGYLNRVKFYWFSAGP